MQNLMQRVFVHNFWLKLVALLFAIGLWMVVARDPIAEVEIKVPIEFRNLPGNLEIDSASFTEAQIRIRGPERVIRRLQASDVHAEIDLASVSPGERTFDLTGRHVHVPQDLEVVQIIPGQFHLSFDERATRTVEVIPKLTGNFASGLRKAKVTTDPPTVEITGPRRRIVAVENATTDPVEISEATTRSTFVTQAYVPDPLIQVVHPTPIRVTVIMGTSGESPENEKK